MSANLNSTKDISNFSAWVFCNEYGTNQSLPDTLKDGWYMPTLDELNSMVSNMGVVNQSLTKVSASATIGSMD